MVLLAIWKRNVRHSARHKGLIDEWKTVLHTRPATDYDPPLDVAWDGSVDDEAMELGPAAESAMEPSEVVEDNFEYLNPDQEFGGPMETDGGRDDGQGNVEDEYD